PGRGLRRTVPPGRRRSITSVDAGRRTTPIRYVDPLVPAGRGRRPGPALPGRLPVRGGQPVVPAVPAATRDLRVHHADPGADGVPARAARRGLPAPDSPADRHVARGAR